MASTATERFPAATDWRAFLFLCATLATTALAVGQDLRRGLVDADAVVVGRVVGKQPFDENVVLHRLQIVREVRGAGGASAVTVLDWPGLSLHNRPMPRQSRLYCLEDASQQATRLGLPADQGPYFKMVGWSGTNPLVGQDLDHDPAVAFATLLAKSEAGAPPAETAAALQDLALHGAPAIRAEAARYLTERPLLRARLGDVHWSQLLSRTAGELEDIDYKIALAELCAEQHIDGLVDALALSLGPIADAEYARTVGRIARLLHGEGATVRLQERLRQSPPEHRAAVLLAIGATDTESALVALLQLRELGKDAAIDAALREHRSPRAKEAVARKAEK